MKFSFGKGIKTWKTEFKLNMTDLGEVLDAFSGCKNIQTTEASNELQAQPPAPQAPGVGKGNSLILSTMGKRSKTTQHWGHTSHRSGAWLGPARQSSQEGHCATVPTTGSPWCHCSFWIWNRNTTEFLTFYPKDNWRYKLRYSWGEKTTKQVLSPLQWESALCVHQSWNLLIMIITKHQSRSSSGRKSQPKYSII